LTLCDRILAADKRIGFAMMVDETGEIVEMKTRGVLLMPKKDIAAFAGIWTSVMGGVSQRMQKYFGNQSGLSIFYEKLNIHGLPVGHRTIVITATKDVPHEILLTLRQIAQTEL